MKIYPSVLASWMILAVDKALVSTKNDEVKVSTFAVVCLLRFHAVLLL